ncbi:hypothetical protein VP277E431_P0130 [Vibrio phage 277E43-1]|nr:hypothetical protein VP277E431_P0130 [Vibrio phage 277E43-1]
MLSIRNNRIRRCLSSGISPRLVYVDIIAP